MDRFESKTKGDREAKFNRIAVRTTSADIQMKVSLGWEAIFCRSEIILFQIFGVKTNGARPSCTLYRRIYVSRHHAACLGSRLLASASER